MGNRKNYHIHIETNNKSWLETARKLEELGLENSQFFLALYDKSLKYINPFSPTLSNAMKNRINAECIRNPWYFFREVFRLPEDGGPARFRLDVATLTYVYLMLNNISLFILAPRQTGKTMTVIAVYVYMFLFRSTGATALFMHLEHDGSKANLIRFKNMVDLLPGYANGRDSKDKWLGVEEVISKIRNNTLKAKPGANDLKNANKLARGLTSSKQYYDEFAFMKHNEIVFKAAIYAFNTASKNAAKNGNMYGVTITTTPNSLDLPEGKYAHDIYSGSLRWETKFFDMSITELKELIKVESEMIFIRVDYQIEEILNTEQEVIEYYDRIMKIVGKDEKNIDREIRLVWPQSSDLSPFDEADLKKVHRHISTTRSSVMVSRIRRLHTYEEIDPNVPYVIGVDVAAGLSGDNTAFVFTNLDTNRVAAVFKNNRINVPNTAILAADFLRKYPNSFMVIERNNQGIAVIQELTETKHNEDISDRVFFQYKDAKDVAKKGSKAKKTKIEKSKRVREYGINTSTNREEYFDILGDIIREHPDRIVSPILYKEIKTLEITKNRIDHMKGEHDDALFGYMVSMYALDRIKFAQTFVTKLRKKIRLRLMTDRQKKNLNAGRQSALSLNRKKGQVVKNAGRGRASGLSFNRRR